MHFSQRIGLERLPDVVQAKRGDQQPCHQQESPVKRHEIARLAMTFHRQGGEVHYRRAPVGVGMLADAAPFLEGVYHRRIRLITHVLVRHGDTQCRLRRTAGWLSVTIS